MNDLEVARLIPEPMRVNEATLMRCKAQIEGRAKQLIRNLLLKIIRVRYGFRELGVGFQWGWPLGVRGRNLKVGHYVYIGAHGSISGPTVIGDLCMISTNVHVVGDDHRMDVVGSSMRIEFERARQLTIIESDCWIGHGVTIKEGVTIGRGSVVGAGSFVNRSVDPYSVVGGVPARLIRMRFNEEQIHATDRALYY